MDSTFKICRKPKSAKSQFSLKSESEIKLAMAIVCPRHQSEQKRISPKDTISRIFRDIFVLTVVAKMLWSIQRMPIQKNKKIKMHWYGRFHRELL